MSRVQKILIVLVIPLAVIGAGAAVAVSLIKSKQAPQTKERVNQGVLVETQAAESTVQAIDVRARGTVKAAKRVIIQPQVNGRITWISDKLVPGGIIEEGEPLFRVDRRDYRLAVDQRKTAVEQAKAQLRIEQGQRKVAEKEWELFKGEVEGSNQDPSLALREPQMKSASVNLEAMESQLERAKLDLSRTTVRAPFNLMVENENVDVGQVVGPNSQAASIVGIDAFWVQLSVPVDRLQYLKIPGINAKEGSEAKVVQTVGTEEVSRTGRVIRLLGELDPVGRMARVLVEVEDPLNLAEADDEARGLPFLLGSYVEVAVTSPRELEVVEVPRSSLHGGDELFVFNDGELDVRTVKVAWSREDSVLISDGVEAGELVVTSRIPTPLDGMKLRRSGGDQ